MCTWTDECGAVQGLVRAVGLFGGGIIVARYFGEAFGI